MLGPIAVRCGRCRGSGWPGGWFQRCPPCGGRGWFDAVSAPGGLGAFVAASDAVRTGVARSLLLRPVMPWESFPVPEELLGHPGAPDAATWAKALRSSAAVLYELDGQPSRLAGGIALSGLERAHAALRETLWEPLCDGGVWRCFGLDLVDFELRVSFFNAWRGEWVELSRYDAASVTAATGTEDA